MHRKPQHLLVTPVCFILVSLLAAGLLGAQSSGIQSNGTQSKIDRSELDTKARRFHVDCDRGQSLVKAAARLPGRPLLVEFSGTCGESLFIERDDFTLRGQGSEAAIVGRIVVNSASRVRLENFTVRDTPGTGPGDATGIGIRIIASQGVVGRNLTVLDTASIAMALESSSVFLTDTTLLRARGIGFFATNNAAITVGGTFTVSDAVVNGICVLDGASVLVLPEARVEAERNPFGVVVEEQAVFTLLNGAHLVASNNQVDGILVITQGDINFGSAVIETAGNGRFGVALAGLSHFAPSFAGATATLLVSGNAAGGVVVTQASLVTLPGGTLITGNGGPGILADEGTLWVDGTTSRDNAGGDAVFVFGSRVTSFQAPNEFGTPVVCDGSVLVRGVTCGNSLVDGAERSLAVNVLQGIPANVRAMFDGKSR